MKILKYIGIGILGLIVLLAIVPVFLPSKTTVVRSIEIRNDSTFNYLSDFNNFKQWSPWQGKDPNMTTTITGTGVGSVYSWKGNDEVGSGSMTISAIEPNKSVSIDLKFVAPWESQAVTKWSVEPLKDGSNRVSWEMSQDLSYGQRYFGLMMDGMIGADFEKGLSNLKANLEK